MRLYPDVSPGHKPYTSLQTGEGTRLGNHALHWNALVPLLTMVGLTVLRTRIDRRCYRWQWLRRHRRQWLRRQHIQYSRTLIGSHIIFSHNCVLASVVCAYNVQLKYWFTVVEGNVVAWLHVKTSIVFEPLNCRQWVAFHKTTPANRRSSVGRAIGQRASEVWRPHCVGILFDMLHG